jgi:rare lipoprotein A
MVIKNRIAKASLRLCVTIGLTIPLTANAANVAEAAALTPPIKTIAAVRTSSTEAASPITPRTTVPRTRQTVDASRPNTTNNVRPRYGRLENTQPANSAAPVAAATAAPRQDTSQVASSGRQQLSAAEVQMASLGIGEGQDVDIAPISDVRVEDIASWQKIGGPYQVNGIWYIPAHEPDYDETGTASWYGNGFNGRTTANGEVFDENIVTVAHPTLPIPSLVEITNLENGRSIVARVNDRGPFVGNRLVDVSARGAQLLGFKEQGSAQVRVRYIGQAPRATTLANTNAQTAQLQIDNITTRGSRPQPTPTRLANNTSSAVANTPVQASQTTSVNRATNTTRGSANRFVQIGVFSNRTNAERALRDASPLGTGQIVNAQTNGSNLFRVVLGPFDDAQTASTKAQEANGLGVNGAHVITASLAHHAFSDH